MLKHSLKLLLKTQYNICYRNKCSFSYSCRSNFSNWNIRIVVVLRNEGGLTTIYTNPIANKIAIIETTANTEIDFILNHFIFSLIYTLSIRNFYWNCIIYSW
jgi:hypothetical protein